MLKKVDKDDKTKLVWNVIVENNRNIEQRNVFNYNWPFRARIYRAYRDFEDNFDEFSKAVKEALMHEYWSRTEYEIIISPWPSHIDENELKRLNQELKENKARYSNSTYNFVHPNIPGSVKIDIYEQILMNWSNFINYLWTNKHYIKEFKKDYCTYYDVKNYYKKKSK